MLKNVFLITQATHIPFVVGTEKNHLNETVLLSTTNYVLVEKIRKLLFCLGAYSAIIFNCIKAIICLENQFLVVLRMAALHRFYCMNIIHFKLFTHIAKNILGSRNVLCTLFCLFDSLHPINNFSVNRDGLPGLNQY